MPTDATTFTVRAATPEDLPTLRRIMSAAIDELQRDHLSPEQIAASHAIMGVDTTLIDDGTYLVVEHRATGDGRAEIAGCGGWSRRATMYGGDHTRGRDDAPLDPATDPARVRAMYTDPRFARRGVGRMILEGCQRAAAAEGFRRLELVATLTGRPLYEAFGFRADEHLTDDSGGAAVPLVRMSKPIPEGDGPLDRYQRLFNLDLDNAAVAVAAAGCLAPDVVFESARRDRPVVGRDAVVEHLLSIREWVAGSDVRHTTAVDRAGRSRRWCWAVTVGDETVEGMDVVTLTADGRIARLAVFDRPLPPPPES